VKKEKFCFFATTSALIGVVGALLLISVVCKKSNASTQNSPVGFIKGYSWGWTGSRGEYDGPAPEQSLRALASTGTEWISLSFAAHMKTKSSLEILYAENNDFMVSDREIRRAIKLAHECGFKIIVKPVVNCLDGAWRATINLETGNAWEQWWQNYELFLLHYARIASETKCEMFCIGCEMRSTEQFSNRWRQIISKVRMIYKQGPIIYNVNHDNLESANWFDSVDIIGVSAYWPVSTEQNTSLNNMLTSWEPIRERLSRLSCKWGKPILFIEIGVRSAKTCSMMPWDWEHNNLPYDGEEQARYYEAAFRTFWNEPWFIGFCWWDWKAQLYDRDKSKTNTDFCAYGKPAEEVLRKWYSKAR
jgi:hypothetical protein